MSVRKQHFVEFISPGTFFSETTRKPIESWDITAALSMSKAIKERYGATPFGFQFLTSIVADPIDDGQGGTLKVEAKEIARTGIHFIGGTIISWDEVKERNKPDEDILRSNMRGNAHWYVIDNRNSWKSVTPFGETDCVVDPESAAVLARGDEPERKAYRTACDALREQAYAADRARRA